MATRRNAMNAIAETSVIEQHVICFDPDMSIADETRSLGEVLFAIANCMYSIGRDGQIIAIIHQPEREKTTRFELGSGMEEHDETVAFIENLKRIHEYVRLAKSKNETVAVTILAEPIKRRLC